MGENNLQLTDIATHGLPNIYQNDADANNNPRTVTHTENRNGNQFHFSNAKWFQTTSIVSGIILMTIAVILSLVLSITLANVKPYRTMTTIASSSSPDSSTTLSTGTATLPNDTNEFAFNKANSRFILKLSNDIIAAKNYFLFTNNDVITSNGTGNNTEIRVLNVTSTNESIIVETGFAADKPILLSLMADDKKGLPIFTSFSLYFGNISMPVYVFFPNGTAAPGVSVQMNLTDDSRIGQQGTTNASGVVVFQNVPSRSVSIFAQTTDNQIGLAGLAPSNVGINVTLIPFLSGNGTKKAAILNNNGRLLNVHTNNVMTLQMQTAFFTSAAGASQVYVEYQFVTLEVPGGYFGSKFNDYYSVTIRSSTGTYRTVSQSMNSLGLNAFNYTTGATRWKNLTMPVGSVPENIQIVIAVANVGDSQYQSWVNVDKFGTDQCYNGTCSKDCNSDCAADPLCSPTCYNPTPKSCLFYMNCMEAKAPCGYQGYATHYGSRNCMKFLYAINSFSSEGKTWIYSTINCLQKALVPPLKDCEKNCETLKNFAFSSHPKCYVDNGVCDMPVFDWITLLSLVGSDLKTYDGFVQAIKTAVNCIPDLIIRLETVTKGIPDGVTRRILLIIRQWLATL